MHSPRPEQVNCHWYTPNITRAEAEALLKEGSPENGYFLVRDSTSAPGDYGLSVVFGGDVIHYQIRHHGQDAFYSIDEGPLIHGLDALVEHYRTSEDGLAVQLAEHYPGTAPPPDSLLHGSSNLLHRATEAGDLKIVSEMLKAGYQQVSYKDAQGQTALHLAARLRRAEILPLLLEHDCSPNVRDSHGLMPLHYAARVNHAQGVRQLVDAGANLQARSSDLNWVPLHEAAHSGALEAVKTLLALNAPSRPRDRSNHTPADLAREANNMDCAEVLVRYKPPLPRRMRSDWLHGAMSRGEAEKKLRAGGFNTGDYLLRTSTRKKSTVLSMVSDDKVFHFEIQEIRTDGELRYVYIDDGPYLDSLEHLVEHYSTLADGLQCRLLHPLPPSPEDAHRAITDNRREVLGPPPPLPLPRLLLSPGTIAAVDLEFGASIGDGEFGKVYQGRWRDPRGRLVDVAIKTCQEVGPSTEADREQLLREAACMKDLRHPCIVRFLGVMQHETLMLVQELVALGSLLDYLTDQPHGVSLETDLKLWAGQVASGMEYLERQRMVHRDLAARNILVASATQVKISDFGFSRLLAGDKDYYVASEGGRWPIKWYAPEAINFGQFSAASDVWSFGVLLWEMFSYGRQPYGDMPGVQAFLDIVEQGQRLEKPEYCPGGIYEVMLKCWAYEPKERPGFSILHQFFSSDNEYRNLSDLMAPQFVSLTAQPQPGLLDSSATENGLPPDPPPSSTPPSVVAAETVAAAAEDSLAVSPPPPPLPTSSPPALSPCPPAEVPTTAEPPTTPPRPDGSPQQAAISPAPPVPKSATPPLPKSETPPVPKSATPPVPKSATTPLPESATPPLPARKASISTRIMQETSVSPCPPPLPTTPIPPPPKTKTSSQSPSSETSVPSTPSKPSPTASPPQSSSTETSAYEPSEVYDVLCSARSVPTTRGERPPVPPKPAITVRRRPPPPDDLLYDAPRSHNLQRLRSESAPPTVLAGSLSLVSISGGESGTSPAVLSAEEASVLRRPAEPPPAEEPGKESAAPSALSPYSQFGGCDRSENEARQVLSPYSQLGGCDDSETYDVPASPLLSPVMDVIRPDSETYDVPVSPRKSPGDSHS